MWMASPACLPGLGLNELKAERDISLKGFYFVFVFNLCLIIICSKHSEASSRAILQLQLGLSLLSSPVLLYREDWRLKWVKYNTCLCWVFFSDYLFFHYYLLHLTKCRKSL